MVEGKQPKIWDFFLEVMTFSKINCDDGFIYL